VGEGGEIKRSEMKPGEGFLSTAKDPSGSHLEMRATFSHKGRRKKKKREFSNDNQV
jgi:hypothetical protein